MNENLLPNYNRAVKAFNAGRDRDAIRLFRKILNSAPNNQRVLRYLAASCQRAGEYAESVKYYGDAVMVQPDDYLLRLGLGISLSAINRREEAIVEFRTACQLEPTAVAAWYNLGETLARQSRADEAHDIFQHTLTLDPAHTLTRLSLANVYASLGCIAKALNEFRHVLDLDPCNASAWFGLSYVEPSCLEAEDSRKIRDILSNLQVPALEREKLEFALAKSLEAQDDYIQAFDVFESANALGRQRARWDAKSANERASAVLRIFSDVCQTRTSSSCGSEVIFIISMPRSGSTLIEQIIASHSLVAGAGEITALPDVLREETLRRKSFFPDWASDATEQDWLRLGQDYLQQTAYWRRAKPRFTDKNLLNWIFVGAIMRMLPNSHIVLVKRDPVETCLACYRQCFDNTHGYSCSLQHTARQYADFQRVTAYWAMQYPLNVTEVRYESLLESPDSTIRHILSFCGLQFDEQCLRYYETKRAVFSLPSTAQVLQPIRRDTARAAKYGDKLNELRRYLREAGVQGVS